ncbi:MAG: hypothetical protein JWQ30_2392 [Sediminibacterium sp.]|nr:hypothetical protein [Sediminibacterium sp.]
MKGRTYQYANQHHFVKSFTIEKENEKFVLITDKARITRKFEQAPDLFSQMFDTKENLAIDKAGSKLKGDDMEITVPAVFGNASGLAEELVAILKENIQKVSSNPSYIKQAQVVDKSVGTILNVQKLKLEMYKAAKTKK